MGLVEETSLLHTGFMAEIGMENYCKPFTIKNKIRRQNLYRQQKIKKNRERKERRIRIEKERKQLGDKVSKKIQHPHLS